MEGISPTIHFVKGTFIFSLQDKLYTLTLEKVPIKYSPMFGQISQQVKMFFTAISFC